MISLRKKNKIYEVILISWCEYALIANLLKWSWGGVGISLQSLDSEHHIFSKKVRLRKLWIVKKNYEAFLHPICFFQIVSGLKPSGHEGLTDSWDWMNMHPSLMYPELLCGFVSICFMMINTSLKLWCACLTYVCAMYSEFHNMCARSPFFF